MDKKTLQNSILEKSYQPEKWVDVMKDYFGAKKFHQKPQSISLPNNDVAENAVELGSFYTADERLVGMYEVHLKPKAWLDKNRVGLRNLLRQVYKYDVDGALIVFIQGEKWRFSFVSEIRTEEGKKETEPKRFTYLFGKGESCRTAAERFDKLKGKPVYLDDLFDAFSVDKLNKDFFKSYKEFFEKFSAHLASNTNYRKLILGSAFPLEKGWQDEAAKPIRDFSKKLLGRIVFLQFLQKKGWMGVPANNEKWTGGNAKFLQNLFLNYADKEHFHSKALKTLFFETLNRKRTNQLAPVALGSNIKIPYLNGGLFDKDVSFDNDIDFPADLFRNLLEFFESYNFTIDENDPYDSEVGIDPEMLGHIFENLLEENREKGAFYTPKEIVHYMCQESLIQYLRTHLPECTEDESPATKALENFIRNGITGERNDKKSFIVQQAKRIEKLLDKVKICDPAIGSGAFPMGMLQEIFKAKTSLDLTLDHAEIKKQIIQNCIYGVDIENGAVEIARLRFWLALVVDEEEPQPLPNLDYKIMQGNSLLESFEGIDLSKVHTVSKTTTIYEPQRDIFGNVLDPQLKFTDVKVLQENNLQQLMQYFFSETDPEKKQAQRELINQTVHEHIDYNLELWQHSLERQIAEAPDLNTQGLKAATKKKIDELHKQLEGLIVKRKKLHELQNAVNKPYFLWHLFFADVFEKGGFDIVIGNPPYLRIQGIRKDDPHLADELSRRFKAATGSFDLYVLFVEQAFNLIKPNAVVNYIMPVKWTNAAFGVGLRSIVSQERFVSKIISFGAYQVFNVSTYTGIQWFKRNQSELLFKELDRDVTTNDELGHFLKDIDNSNFSRINFKSLNEESWVLTDKIKATILSKLNSQQETLKNVFEKIFQGIATSSDRIYVLKIIEERNDTYYCYSSSLDSELVIEKGLVKPFLMGKDVKRYDLPDVKHVVIFPYDISDKENPKLMSLEYIKMNFPHGYKYLLANQKELEARENGKMKHERFYAYIYPKNLTDFANKKILTAEIANKGEMTIDEDGYYYHTTKVYSLALKKNLPEDISYFLGVLNSKILFFFLSSTGYVLRGGYFTFKTDYLNPFPIRRIDFLKTNDKELHDQLVKLVYKTINLKSEQKTTTLFENKIEAIVFHLYGLNEQEMLQVLDTFKDLSIKDRNQIQNEYWNIANNKFQLEK
jgi:adenine-specific DNA-methyltransferase